jgi:predicted PurR-regulated permease PerM
MLTDPNSREVSPRSPVPRHTAPAQHNTATSIWTRRLIILLTILVGTVLVVALLWAASYVITAILIFIVASLIAYAIIPIVAFIQRIMPRLPRPIAITVVYVIVLGLLGLLIYFIIKTMILQLSALAHSITVLLQAPKNGQDSPLVRILKGIGLSSNQITNLGTQLSTQLTNFVGTIAGGILPLITSVAGTLVNILITVVISIYLLVDGSRGITWLRNKTPLSRRGDINMFFSTLEHVVGGYIRGQLALSAIIATIVGIGMAMLGLSSYAILLAVLSFVTEFIPVLGTIFCGTVAVLLALTQGWLTAVLVLAYFILVHIFEGYILAPRLIGKAVGLHPAVSLMALVIGGELFGVWGAIFASPLAGLLQAFAVAFWINYSSTHREEFPPDEVAIVEKNVEPQIDRPIAPPIQAGESSARRE